MLNSPSSAITSLSRRRTLPGFLHPVNIRHAEYLDHTTQPEFPADVHHLAPPTSAELSPFYQLQPGMHSFEK